LVFVFLLVSLPFRLHVRTQLAVHNEVVAHVNRPLVDRLVAPHSGKDVALYGADNLGVLVFILCVAFFLHVRMLYALVAAQVLEHIMLRSVAKRVFVYFLHVNNSF
jgi:hypothetical protein